MAGQDEKYISSYSDVFTAVFNPLTPWDWIIFGVFVIVVLMVITHAQSHVFFLESVIIYVIRFVSLVLIISIFYKQNRK